MPGEQDKLREILDQLQTQLDAMRQRDPAVAAELETILGEAKALLAGGPAPKQHRSLVERLSDAVIAYEASHPSLSSNLGSIIDALARMGI